MNEGVKVSGKAKDKANNNSTNKKNAPDLSPNLESPVGKILSLQRTIGNGAMQNLIESGILQTKLKIGKPGDKYELEADRIAEQVMRMTVGSRQKEVGGNENIIQKEEKEEIIKTKPLVAQITPLVQRQEEEEEEEEEPIQTKLLFTEHSILQRQVEPEEEEEEEELIQPKPISESITPLAQRQVEDTEKKKREEEMFQAKERSSRGTKATADVESSIDNLRGKGESLPESMRSYFESRFGYDFSGVRVHTGNEATEAASSINARAFALGSNVVFGGGAYAPETFEGKRLLAHELTHVIQQNGVDVPQIKAYGRKVHYDMTSMKAIKEEFYHRRAPTIAQADRLVEQVMLMPGVENRDRITPIKSGTQPIVQRNNDKEAEEIAKRALKHITMITMQETAEWLAQRDFSSTDPRVIQAAPKLSKAAQSKFEGVKTGYRNRIKAVQTSIDKLSKNISDLGAKSERTEQDDTLLDQYKSALQTLTARKEIESPEATWNSSHCRFKEREEKDFANKKLGQYKGKVGVAISGAKTASQTYASALGEFGKAKTVLREKLEKLGIYDSEKDIISPCVKPIGDTKQPPGVSDAHLEKIKKGEGFAPLPYIALEGACTIGYGHVLHWKRCADPPVARCWEPGDGKVPVGGQSMPECITYPRMGWSKARAHEMLKKDVNVHAEWIKEHIHVDLDQGQFDALVDISGHVGHVPESLAKEVHAKICTDDEAVRKKYMETALYIKGKPEAGPVFGKRRKERVWPSKELEE